MFVCITAQGCDLARAYETRFTCRAGAVSQAFVCKDTHFVLNDNEI